MEHADAQDEIIIDPTAVAAALEKLKRDSEPEARFMRMSDGSKKPAYNVQTAVDAEHGIIVAQQVTTEANDVHSLQPMAEAAKEALGQPETLNVVADAGYSNGKQAEQCESQGILPHVPAQRAVNNQGGGQLFDRKLFTSDETSDTFRCPANQTLTRQQVQRGRKRIVYAAPAMACAQCPLKSQCTTRRYRRVNVHLHDAALTRMNQRATREAMRLRRRIVERPFAVLKHVILGNARLLLRRVTGAKVEISLATMAYNLKTMISVLGAHTLVAALS